MNLGVNAGRCAARWWLALGLAACWLGPLGQLGAADSGFGIPPVLQKGFNLYGSGGAEPAVLAWCEGGMLEGDNRGRELVPRLKAMTTSLGTYKGYEVVDAKWVGKSTRILYLTMLFERGAVYGRFLLYRAPKDWVAQHVDFYTRPEAIMPWLAMESEK